MTLMTPNNREEIIMFWADSLVKLSHTIVDPLPIDTATRQLLTHIGLPRQISLFPDEDLTLEFRLDGPFKIDIHKNEPVTQIGQMGEAGIYIYIAADGTVTNRTDLGDDEDQWRFMNSSLEQFLRFIVIYKRLYPDFWVRPDIDFDDLDDEEQEEKLAQLAADFRAQFEPYDPKAFENDETWWSIAVEQMEDGLW
jgi:hypothetical protein